MKLSFKQLKQIVNLCIEVTNGAKIKNLCNKLNSLGITDVPIYSKRNEYSCYQIFRRLYYNYMEFGVPGLLDNRGK